MTTDERQPAPGRPIALALHGGAGILDPRQHDPALDRECRAALGAALEAGYAVLRGGGSSLDAVQAAITPLEDSPLFNAGHGAVFTHDGRNELDASIMAGDERRAGAVAGLNHVRNPIALARMVMERSPHVMLMGRGAEEFALDQGMALVPQAYFHTERRWQALQAALEREKARAGDPDANLVPEPQYLGTVGAVALDADGQLAAGTSTGGTTNKRWGRIGDSPLPGAGTWADNRSCAVSTTGTGEYFIRCTAAREVAVLVQERGLGLAEAARTVIEDVASLGGDGGLVAVDGRGNVALEFNTNAMYRAAVDARGRRFTGIYAGDSPSG